MVRSADPSNRSGKYCQSRTRVSVSEPLVRRPRGRVSEPSPWSRSSFTFLRCFRHQLLLPRPYLVLTKPLRLDIQCQRGASVKIGWKYLDD